MNIAEKIATELNIKTNQVNITIELLDGGATVPFISRYRKEATGGLSDTTLRALAERLQYLRELEDRRQTILKSIAEQGKLSSELEQMILQTYEKGKLEDLYLPYKPKRRTKAQIAKEAGLEPLAMTLLNNPTEHPEILAEKFLNPEHQIHNAKEALEGAKQILMEIFSEDAALLGRLRDYLWEHGYLKTEVSKGKEEEGKKFADYFAYQEAIKKVPSHRALAVFRGQTEEILRVNLFLNETEENVCTDIIANTFNIKNANRPADTWLKEVVSWSWRIKLFTKLSIELLVRLRENAEIEAIHVFANNLKHLLMASPAGSRVTMGLDPGLRTGVKVVVIDDTGKLLGHTAIFPHAPRNDWDGSIAVLAKLCKHFNIELISIGNGTASRETDKLVADLKKKHSELKLTSIVVSEAGASVYSASELASEEFPDLDVSYRGAISIARRLQDPLAELVKIEPKSIGVGQYQHDVNQFILSTTLSAVMEDCVNAVGVNINTASAPLLSCVAGLNNTISKNIIEFRDKNGQFKNRNQLKKVPRLGDKAFEQCAGFLRIVGGENPLDASAVHPEAYPIVERILAKQSKSITEIMGNTPLIKKINPRDYIDEKFGIPTVTDILNELEKPGLDPRPEFKTAAFKEGIEKMEDLKSGMILEGVVTNVANFGAFVDIGVHQDGLVHVSMLSNKFIKTPSEVVKVGDIVQVKVLEVDLARKRIQLTMRLTDSNSAERKPTSSNVNLHKSQSKNAAMGATLGDVLLKALNKN